MSQTNLRAELAALERSASRDGPGDPAPELTPELLSLVGGCQFSRHPDVDDPRYEYVTMRMVSDAATGGEAVQLDARGQDAINAWASICATTYEGLVGAAQRGGDGR